MKQKETLFCFENDASESEIKIETKPHEGLALAITVLQLRDLYKVDQTLELARTAEI